MNKYKRVLTCILSLILIFNFTTIDIRAIENEEINRSSNGVGDINIISQTSITVERAQEWAKSKNATEAFIALAPLYEKYAKKRGGVNWAVAYVQAAKETGYGRFGGVLDESFHNPCGLKNPAGGGDYDPDAHKRFDNWDQGVMAHLDHLALYAGAQGYPKIQYIDKWKGELVGDETYDPRHIGWYSTLHGKSPTVNSLGGAWAPSETYGVEIFRLYCDLTNTKYLDAKSNLESIKDGQVIDPQNLNIVGWGLHAFGIKQVRVSIDGIYLEDANIGISRNDVYNLYPEYFNSSKAGFENTYDISNFGEGQKKLKVQIIANDNSIQTIERAIVIGKETLEARSSLDLPKVNQSISNGELQVAGWALHDSGIKEVKVSIDGKYIGSTNIGITRNDVNNAYPGYPNGDKSGFDGKFDISNLSNGDKKVKVEIVANDNSVQTYERTIKVNKVVLEARSWLDTPAYANVITDKSFNVEGWALHSSGIKEVKVYLDGTFISNAVTGISRLDVNSAYPGYPNGDKSGFKATIDTSLITAGNKKLVVKIIANDNSIQEIEREIVIRKKTLVVIDPGHENTGGDPGAIATHNGVKYIEADLNLQIAVKLKAELEKKGIDVYMTRYDGSGLISTDSSESLRKRVSVANEMNADFFVSIHHNSFTSSSANGFEVYYSTGTPISVNSIRETNITEDGRDLTLERTAYSLRSNSDKVTVSKNIATKISSEASSKLDMYNRGAKDSNLYVCKNTNMPSILIENGFLTNPTEAAKVSTSEHQQKLAEIIANNINNIFN